MEYEHDQAIEQLLNTKTREAIIDFIDQYGGPINWDNYTTREILEEVSRSDSEAGEYYDGILSNMYQSL